MFPVRYTALALCVAGLLASLWGLVFTAWGWLPALAFAALAAVGVHDLTQKTSTLRLAALRNHNFLNSSGTSSKEAN